MVVDNKNQIKKLIEGCDDGEFYMLQIIHRTKDGQTKYENSKATNQIIKTYYISSHDHLEYKMEEIRDLCQMFNARAYINLNKKSWRQIALKSIEELAKSIAHDEYRSVKSLVESSCGQTGACDGNKTWLVDIDTKDLDEVERIKTFVQACEPKGVDKIVDCIPTLHGYHLITKPFNKKTFHDLYNEHIDIHDNNPTLLYGFN